MRERPPQTNITWRTNFALAGDKAERRRRIFKGSIPDSHRNSVYHKAAFLSVFRRTIQQMRECMPHLQSIP